MLLLSPPGFNSWFSYPPVFQWRFVLQRMSQLVVAVES